MNKINSNDFIFDTFIKLTSKTVPYGYEEKFVKSIFNHILPKNLKLNKDKHNNYFIKVGNSNTVFASHLDTVSKDYVQVNHVIEKNIIKTDGKTTLGADDKAGVTIMLWMIYNNVPGLYYFFIGEEVGCIGSGDASKDELFKNYNKIISFDRYGTNSIITHQSCQRSASDKFVETLCQELNSYGFLFEPDSGGVYTDSAEFISVIPECTNISVGYYKQHTFSEYQDIRFLTKLAEVCVLIDWENLPIIRNPNTSEYNYNNYNNYINDFENEYVSNKNKVNRRKRSKKTKKIYIDSAGTLIDTKKTHDYNFDFSFFSNTRKKETYDWIMEKYLNNHFTWNELQTIKECYLDMKSDYDVSFYNYLKESIVNF
jgi:hypothetical protein